MSGGRENFDLDLIRSRLNISEVIGQDVSWDLKKSNPSRGDWWGCCPFHGEKTPSFHADDRKGRYYCFGCKASGDHFKYLMETSGMSFVEAVKTTAGMAGVGAQFEFNDNNPEHKAKRDRERAEYQRKRDALEREAKAKTEKKQQNASQIWNEGVPIDGTPAAKYLFNRGGFAGPWPTVLRYHPNCFYELEGKPWQFHPAMICRVDNDAGELIGIWRIFITEDGQKNEALVNSKVGLGPCGGGAVRLWPADSGLIGAAEGVETSFGVRSLTGVNTWATLSTSGLVGFQVPFEVDTVRIFPDGDGWRLNEKTGVIEAGPGIQSAKQAQINYQEQGIRAIVEAEPDNNQDYLDIWNHVRAYA